MRLEIAEAKANWRELVSEQSQSGLSVAAFCSQRGLRAWGAWQFVTGRSVFRVDGHWLLA
jgi:hypothetical protein